ncbi:FkbM family methyltransferase [Comamonas sp.]|uniref:FkbM family methyltransferase n=1 Tax=Comamonas sp. TaxID=34028 RepID=UPI0028995AFC|nr:FkbM family methyltransferase [Comamonas sp.]
MMLKSIAKTVMSVPYHRFFANKIRHAVFSKFALNVDRRDFRLFTLDNDAIGNKVRAQGSYEPEVLAAIDMIAKSYRLHDGVALDVGANIGNHSVSMSRVFSRVIAFEPDPVMAAALNANKLLNGSNINIIEAALSAKAGKGLLRRLHPGHCGMLELVSGNTFNPNGCEDTCVTLARGDDILCNEISTDERIVFIKIDVEGSELDALNGLIDCLTRFHPIICFEVRNPVEGQQVKVFLESIGYDEYYSISRSRLKIQYIHRLFTSSGRCKNYALERVDYFEDRHYAAVFAFASSNTGA